MPPRTEIGTTIKLEEFERYPNGLISAGVISNSVEDGVDVSDYTDDALVLYKVVKESNQDWYIEIVKWDKDYTLTDNIRESEVLDRVTSFTEVKRIFNVSKKVFDLLTQ